MNKILGLFLAIGLFSAISCKKDDLISKLQAVDDLCYVDSQKAMDSLEILKQSVKKQSKPTRMYYQLLCIKAADKARKLQPSDSIMQILLDYYEPSKSEHRAEAFYYAGRTKRLLGNSPKAVEYYRKAELALENKSDPLAGYIYSQIGGIYIDQCLTDAACKFFKKGYNYSRMQNDTIGMLFDLKDIGYCYESEDCPDSAALYYAKAHQLAIAAKDTFFIGVTNGSFASLYTGIGKYDSAKVRLQKALQTLNPMTKRGLYTVASNLYTKIGQIDSAVHYSNLLLEDSSVVYTSVGNHNLAKIALQNEDIKQTKKYLAAYLNDSETLWKLNNMEAVRRVQALYDYTEVEKENSRLQMESSRKNFIMVVLALSLGLIGILLVAAVIALRRRRLQMELQRIKIEQMEAQGQERKESPQMEKPALPRLEETDIYRYFHAIAAQKEDITVPAARWDELQQQVDACCSNFSGQLLSIHPLSSHELRICLLLKLGLQPAHIARLTQHSRESITSARRRMYEKFFMQRGTPKDWDDFIGRV